MEEKLKEIAKPYLDKCRPGDWNHALRVVKWVKILGKNRKDLNLIIIAAYLHDIGWFGILKRDKLDLDEMLKYEEKANENTNKFVNEVLNKLKYSNEELSIVLRLIGAADKHESQTDDEAIMLMRKLIMHIAVEEGDEEGKKFIQYIDFLCKNGIVPRKSKNKADSVRDLGNSANHEIESRTKEEAQNCFEFIELLLKVNYELADEREDEK